MENNERATPTSGARRLYRVMIMDTDGHPTLGRTAACLGVRVLRPSGLVDLPVHSESLVFPREGGMSVSVDSWRSIHPTFLDRVRDRDTRDRLWCLSETDLGVKLACRIDPRRPEHGFIEPLDKMTLAEYEEALAFTRLFWTVVPT